MTATAKTTARGYNLNVTPIEISTKADKAGKPFMTARVSCTIRGRETVRTLQLRGRMIEEVGSTLALGVETPVRAIFERAPAIGDAKRGGDFLVAVGLPRVANTDAANDA